MALTASADYATKNTAPMNYPSEANSRGYEANQATSDQLQTTLTLYVLDGGVNGPVLPGATVIAYDASGSSFNGITDSKGAVSISGKPGNWRFTISKEGYETVNSNYDVTETHTAATYLQKNPLPQETVALTIYVHDGNLTGPQLPGVQVSGQDASGNGFNQLTNSDGSVVINGQPGTWQFMFAKDGYNPVSLNYSVTATQTTAAYLQKNPQTQEQVALTIYVHDGNLTGPQLPGVQVTGQDASGNGFSQLTNSDGSVIINGQPGIWQLMFSKDGYNPVSLNFSMTGTQTTAAYLQRIAQTQETVALTIYVHDGNLTGPQLPGVQVSGQDASGNGFSQVTNSDGSVVINGQPGTWQFVFSKDGYKPVSLNYSVTATQATAAYLQKNPQTQEQVALTIYVHDGNLTGPRLPGVQVSGQDASGNGFSQLTNADGSVVINGQPGTWQFTFSKDGYNPVSLNYNVTETQATAAYLQSITA
jgi:phosphatidate phosphatase APP1